MAAGAQLGNFERGQRYICNWKDEIILGHSPSVKCVAPLFRDMPLVKCIIGRAPQAPLPSCALVLLLRLSEIFEICSMDKDYSCFGLVHRIGILYLASLHLLEV